MKRLLIHVEGETEESFVNEVLAPHLGAHGFQSVRARLIGNARQRSHRGGISGWHTVQRDIVGHLREDRNCIATTMVDYYGLPENGRGAWPGRAEASNRVFSEKAGLVETSLLAVVKEEMGNGFKPSRFVPYLMMHEFEALLFSDCEGFARGIGRPEMSEQFQNIRNTFANPEEINDSPIRAPSKRIEALVGGYQKVISGTLAALEIGLPSIRAECPHFSGWLSQLEGMPANM